MFQIVSGGESATHDVELEDCRLRLGLYCRLGQFASMAGIDQSEFGIFGNPQLSSTERRPIGHDDQANEENVAMMSVPVSGTSANNVDVSQSQPLQELPLIPASVSRASPILQEPLAFEAPEQRASAVSRSGSSLSSASTQSKGLKSYRSNGSEGKVFSAVGSRASSLSHLGSGVIQEAKRVLLDSSGFSQI
ncbi:uncharacterized protein [Misgurnus anguillicaudatus]|uniref:uncharacterized protein n=1 Tax=Misgurnus anguillicaudatus TaxID=75329 RepID=UPI003CCF5389